MYGGAESVALVDEVVAECTDDNLYEFMRRFKVREDWEFDRKRERAAGPESDSEACRLPFSLSRLSDLCTPPYRQAGREKRRERERERE